jgi:hypothetical protein
MAKATKSRRKPKYEWARPGLFPVAPEVAKREFDRLEEIHGKVYDAEVIVEAARSRRNPLHPAFEWDDAKAADEHRKTTARTMQRSLMVQRPDNGGYQPPIPYRMHIQTTEVQGYARTEVVLSDADMREAALALARTRLDSFRACYRHLTELARIMKEIDKFFPTTTISLNLPLS